MKRVYNNAVIRQGLIIVGLYFLYRSVRVSINSSNLAQPFTNAQRVLHLEQVFHFSWEVQIQQFFLGIPELIKAMNFYYFACQFVLTGLFFVWMFFYNKQAFYFLRNALGLASLIALVIFWVFPTAPPRLAEVGMQDTLNAFSNINIGSTDSIGGNVFAAVPSLHAVWATIVGFGIIAYGRFRGRVLLGIFYPLSVIVTIVATGNHFIFDAIAGIVLSVFALISINSFRVTALVPKTSEEDQVNIAN